MPRRRRAEGDGWPVRWISAVAALLAVASVLAFLPALKNGFVNFDDNANYLANGSYRGLGPAQLAWAWTTYRVGAYQPLTWMLLEAEYVGWGLDPAGYHSASLALHVAVAVAFYLLTLDLLDRARPDWRATRPSGFALLPGLAVALFAVHPMRVEVVAWASGQGYLPCALFGALAVLAYLRANPGGRPGCWGRSCCSPRRCCPRRSPSACR